VLTTSANLAGGVTGKIILPQSLAIACAAAGVADRETDLIGRTWRCSRPLLEVMVLLVLLPAYIVPSVVPRDVPGLSP
jgi:L-lactate permease